MTDLTALNLESGSLVGGYTLISRLGGGAMGSVWRVKDDGGNIYAMKILRDSLNEEAEQAGPAMGGFQPGAENNATTARERLRREAAALRRVNHPGVCQIVDMELDDSLAFIVTELIEGKNLRADVAANGRYVAGDLERLTRKLIEAVSAVHRAGIIHRDIKPTNVMISRTGPVLVDFGIAMGEGESHVTRTGLVMGTPGFIAPEIIDGAESDEQTDWWSTAAVLAFAATGQPVFGTNPMMAVLERAASGHANLAGLPPHTTAAFRSALSPKREDRCTPMNLLQVIEKDALTPELWTATASAPTNIAKPLNASKPLAHPLAGSGASATPAPSMASIPLPPKPGTAASSISGDAPAAEGNGVVRPFGKNSSRIDDPDAGTGVDTEPEPDNDNPRTLWKALDERQSAETQLIGVHDVNGASHTGSRTDEVDFLAGTPFATPLAAAAGMTAGAAAGAMGGPLIDAPSAVGVQPIDFRKQPVVLSGQTRAVPTDNANDCNDNNDVVSASAAMPAPSAARLSVPTGAPASDGDRSGSAPFGTSVLPSSPDIALSDLQATRALDPTANQQSTQVLRPTPVTQQPWHPMSAEHSAVDATNESDQETRTMRPFAQPADRQATVAMHPLAMGSADVQSTAAEPEPAASLSAPAIRPVGGGQPRQASSAPVQAADPTSGQPPRQPQQPQDVTQTRVLSSMPVTTARVAGGRMPTTDDAAATMVAPSTAGSPLIGDPIDEPPIDGVPIIEAQPIAPEYGQPVQQQSPYQPMPGPYDYVGALVNWYIPRGRMLLCLLAVPLCLFAASVPAGGLIVAVALLWALTTLGLSRKSQFVREGKRGGMRKGTDSALIVGALPWHLVKGLTLIVAPVLLMLALFLALAAFLAVALGLPDATGYLIVFGLEIHIPLIAGDPMSESGFMLMICMAAGWFAAALGPYSRFARLGAGTLRGSLGAPCAPTSADELGTTQSADARNDRIQSAQRHNWTLTIIWTVLILAGVAMLIAGSSIDWSPLPLLHG